MGVETLNAVLAEADALAGAAGRVVRGTSHHTPGHVMIRHITSYHVIMRHDTSS